MTAHVNEYDPNSKDSLRGVQTDTHKLKFNNIQSCLALVLCVYNNTSHGAPTINRLIGVHINTINLLNNEIEVNIALSNLKQDKNTLLDVYLVGPYDQHYAGSRLAEKLKYLSPRAIKLFNLTPPIVGSGADQDVKVEVSGNLPNVYYRNCVKVAFDTVKDKYNPAKGGRAYNMADFKAGKHENANNRAENPWQLVTNFRTLH